ncbi:MAG: NAD(P)H-hydrate dehydratase [Pseudomonadota bacterium]
MSGTPNDIYSVASVREIDRIAIEERGTPGYELMTRAAMVAADVAVHRFGNSSRCHVVCGSGNNAGDGYLVAAWLKQTIESVKVTAVSDPSNLSGDAKTAYEYWLSIEGSVEPFVGSLENADYFVDAILGSGIARPVSGDYARAIDAMNQSGQPILALDLPSGLNGDTGDVMGVAVQADATCTFVGRKAGSYLGQGPDACGDILLANLQVPDEVFATQKPVMRSADIDEMDALLPPRRRSAHKGDFGHVLVVGGGPGMAGAARLCGEAALRTGAGRVSVATHPDNALAMLEACPELMVTGVASTEELVKMLSGKDVIAFGPGLGTDTWAEAMFAGINGRALPMVWDADALNLLANSPTSMPNRIITPHPGEAGALLESSAGEVQSDRLHALKALNSRYGGVSVLKGAGTLITEAASPPWICLQGNPGMATAGMGDVLTGTIAALLAQGLDLESAARLGVCLHAQAADSAAEEGERGLIASDVIAELRKWAD